MASTPKISSAKKGKDKQPHGASRFAAAAKTTQAVKTKSEKKRRVSSCNKGKKEHNEALFEEKFQALLKKSDEVASHIREDARQRN